MNRNGLFSAVTLSFLLSGPVFAQATKVVEGIYSEYQRHGPGSSDAPDMYTKDWYSTKIRAQINRMNAACKGRDEQCGPDWDFLVDGQDFEIKNLEVREVKRTGRKAMVEAKFTNFGNWRTMNFSMIEENGRWVIDEMVGKSKSQPEGYKLTDILIP